MIFWPLFALYWIGWLLTLRSVSWIIATQGGDLRPDGETIVAGLFFGSVFSLAWPLLVPGYLAYQSGALTRGSHAFMRAPRNMRDKLRLEEQAERIRELEREVGIR